MISAVLEISFSCQGSNVSCFMLCHEVSLGYPWLRRLLFVVDDSSSLFSFPNFSDPSLRLMICVRNFDGTVSLHTRHCRSSSGKIRANSAPFPNQSHTIGHDGSSCGGGASVRGSDRMTVRVKNALYFLHLLVPRPPGKSPPYFNESSFFEKPMWYSNVAYLFSIFLRETLTYPGSREWHCRAPMYTGSSRWRLGMIFLIELHACHTRLFLPRISHFLCLTGEFSNNLTRCQSSDHVRPFFFFWTDMPCSLQNSAPSLSRFLSCLVNQCVFLVVSPGRPLGHGTTAQLPWWIGRCSRFPLAIKCDTLWACWRLIVLIFCQNDTVDWRNLTTILNFFWTLILPKSISQGCSCLAPSHQCLSFLPCWKDICDRPSSASGTGSSKLSSTFKLGWFEFLRKVFWAFHRCFWQARNSPISRISAWSTTLQSGSTSSSVFPFALRQLSFLSVESVNSSFPLPSIFRCLHAKCFQQGDALAQRFTSAVWAQR